MVVLFPLKLAVVISNILSRLKSTAIISSGLKPVEYVVCCPK